MKTRGLLLTLLLLPAVSAVAETAPGITPASGPTTGGTEVTIRGEFSWPDAAVMFGRTRAPEARRIDQNTIVAKTPPHLPGSARVYVFDYDMWTDTGVDYVFAGEVPESYERVLLPLFTPPTPGAFGSEFRTDFTAHLEGGDPVKIYGVHPPCAIEVCSVVRLNERPMELGPWNPHLQPGDLEQTGRPGRFVYFEDDDLTRIAMNLRVHDTSRSSENYGTEMPIVRESAFVKDRLMFVGVPTHSRFRNTLRIYSAHPAVVTVLVAGAPARDVVLSGGADLFEPAYGVFTDFPTVGGTTTVTVDAPPAAPGDPAGAYVPIWGFISITNNETQLISTITPQP